MVLNQVAHEKGIYVIELQHGTMAKNHIAYHYESDGNIKNLPDEILFFSDYWKNMVKLPSNVELVSTGFPYFETQKEKYPSKLHTKQTILFISQGTIGVYLSQFAVELFSKIDKNKYKIMYKLHPGEYFEWEKRYPWLKQSEVNVIDDNSRSIYELFAVSDIQIGVYSTALYEGLGYYLDTYIYGVGEYEEMEKVIENGYGKLVFSVDELLELLGSNSGKCNNMDFWKTDALNNIMQEIEKRCD